MSEFLDAINQRSDLAGQNRLELLLFRLIPKQLYAINVFKIREVLRCPPLKHVPLLHPAVKGFADIRGQTISIIDMSFATGGKPIKNCEDQFIIVCEFNRSVQGFLVCSLERIVNINWEAIQSVPEGAGNANYLTAVTQVDGKIIEILDVEKILEDIAPSAIDINDELAEKKAYLHSRNCLAKPVLIVDDSSIARQQVNDIVTRLGLTVLLANDGAEAMNTISRLAEQGDINDQLAMVISDIEMPNMDGYTLTTQIRKNDKLKGLQVLLHSSLSGSFNESMVKRVGADDFVAKLDSTELSNAIIHALNRESS